MSNQSPPSNVPPSPIVLVLCDQMRWDCLGTLGHPDVRTPHLDALAADGVVFRNTVTPSPVCVPARACLFTGRYPHELGCYGNDTQLWPETPNIVRAVRDAGYHTVQRGKLHLFWRHDNELLTSGPMLRTFGFTDAVETTGKCSEGRLRASAYSEHLRQRGLMDGFWRDLVRRVDRPTGTEDAYPSLLDEPDHLDAWVMDRGCEAIDTLADHAQAGDPQPFLLWLGPPGPHDPFDPPEPWASSYEGVTLRSRPILADSPDPHVLSRSHAARNTRGANDAQLHRMRAMYFANIALIDHKVGQLVSALRRRGLYDASTIVFVSDHGELLGDFHVRGKAFFHRGADQVPLVIKPPAEMAEAPRGRASDALVNLIDVGATMLDLAGATLEGHRGRSLLPLLQGQTPLHQHRRRLHSQVRDMAMVRDARHKLVLGNVRHDTAPDAWRVHALYDLEACPDETRSIHASDSGLTRRLITKWAEPFWRDVAKPGSRTWDDTIPFRQWGRHPPIESLEA